MLKKKNIKRKVYQLDSILNEQKVQVKSYLLIDRASPKYTAYAPYICIWYDRINDDFMRIAAGTKRKVFCATPEIRAKLDEFQLDREFEELLSVVEWGEPMKKTDSCIDESNPKTRAQDKKAGKNAKDLGLE